MKIEGIENTAVDLAPQEHIISGLKLLSKTVQVTLGPAGQLVALQMKLGQPTFTKDGVTVARYVWSKDTVENATIQTLVSAAGEMNTLVGDGTTTTIILAAELTTHLLQLKGKDYQDTLKYLRKYFNIGVDAVKRLSRQIDNDLDILKAVADIACNGDEQISKIVAEAVNAVGKDGVVTYQDSPSGEPYYEVGRGIIVDRGYISSHFLGKEAKLVLGGAPGSACMIFISADTLTESEELLPVLGAAVSTGQPLLVVAPDITGNALGIMVVNAKKNTLQCCGIRAPGSGERRAALLQDIAVATGGRIYSSDTGMVLREMTSETILHEFLGKADQAVISDRRTVIVNPGGDEDLIKEYIARLRDEQAKNPLEQQKYQERIAQLTGGIGTVYVPGYNISERVAGRYFVEDGINACFAALRGGIIPGGGAAFRAMIHAVEAATPESINDERARDIFLATVKKPIELLIANALEGGIPGHRTYSSMVEFLSLPDDEGIDLRTMKVVNFDQAKIWEPLLVPLTAMKLAYGCATTLGNAKAFITQKSPEKS